MNEIALKEIFPDVDPALYEYLSDGGDSDDEAADDGDFDGVQLNESFGNAIVVDNIPKVGTEKLEKLKKVLCKIFFKSQNRADRIAMPAGDDGKTLGFAFIEFDDDKAAAEAVKQRNNFKLDKAHVFKVNRYPDLARFANTPEEYAEPAAPAYEQQEDLLAFLGDAAVRDQFLLRHANTTEIQWVRSDGITELDYDGAKQRAAGRRTWCDMYTLWSPRGTYLATYHRQGIALWGGKSWNQMQKFPQAGVQHCCFSPRENYVVTWNGRDDGKDPKACMTWNLKTGRAMRPFAVWKGSQWPVFRWSHDDKYFARRTQQGTGIQVYETPSCKMVGNKPLRSYLYLCLPTRRVTRNADFAQSQAPQHHCR